MANGTGADLEFLNDFNKTALLIDGLSIHSLAWQLDIKIDYSKLLDLFTSRTPVIKSYYFTAVDTGDANNPVESLLNWLSLNGFICCLTEYDGGGDKERRASIEIDFTIRALNIANEVDQLVLFTGAGKFVPLVRELDRMRKSVTICSSLHGENRHVSQALRRVADHFIDLYLIRDQIQMEQRER